MKELLIVIYFVLFAINFLLMIFHKKNRAVTLLTYLLMFFLFMNNTAYGDAPTYKRDYEVLARDTWEPGYDALKWVAQTIGIKKYSGFLAVLFLFASCFLIPGFRALKVNPHILFSVSMPFLFPWFAVVIRFFLGTSIAVYALHHYVKGRYFRYIFWILIAMLFHRTSAAFLLVLFAKPLNRFYTINKRYLWKLVIGVISAAALLVVLYTFVKKQFLFVDTLVNILSMVSATLSEKAQIYLSRLTQWGAIPVFMVFFANWYLARSMKKKAALGDGENRELIDLTVLNYRISFLFVVVIPTVVLSVNFGRFFIIPTLMNLYVFGWFYPNERKGFRGLMLTFLFLILCWELAGMINFAINPVDLISNCGLFE